jgi:hypothetical protein
MAQHHKRLAAAHRQKAAPSVIPEATLLLEEGATAIERERSRIPALPGQVIALSAMPASGNSGVTLADSEGTETYYGFPRKRHLILRVFLP